MIAAPDQQLHHTAGVVNKAELAAILRTSLPTLDKMLRLHGDRFPIVHRGSNGKSYKFDPAAVTAFLSELEQARIAAGRAKDELMQQYTLPDLAPTEEPALSPRDRLQLAKLRQIERDEQIRAGFLVEAAAVRAAIFTAFASLRRDMQTAIRQELRRANTPEPVIRSIEARIADAQRTAVTAAQDALQHATDTPADGDQPALV